MRIQSLSFFIFTAFVLVLYYTLDRKKQNILLFLTSYIFYISVSMYFTLLLLVMTIANFFLGKEIKGNKQGKKVLLIGIVFNILVLAFFKSADFFLPEVLAAMSKIGFNLQNTGLKILLPVGLSFYTLQAIAYLIDVYRKQVPVCLNYINFSIYLAYFPKLTAGPIERAGSFLSKLEKHRIVDSQILTRSLSLLMVGLFRKIVIADTLLKAVPDGIFQNPLNFSSLELIIWLLIFGFGLYNDFCGYTNIMRGISGFFGIELTRNFALPLFSTSLTEFWNRWHMSLSFWLRDYVYFPMGRYFAMRNQNQSHFSNIIFPPLVTMLVSSLWHGFSLNLLIWGFLMGVALIGERLLSLNIKRKVPFQKSFQQKILGTIALYFFLMFSLTFFVFDINTVGQFFFGLVKNMNWILPESHVFILLLPALWLDIQQYRFNNESFFLSYNKIFQISLFTVVIWVIVLFSTTHIPSAFIYQGF